MDEKAEKEGGREEKRKIEPNIFDISLYQTSLPFPIKITTFAATNSMKL